jgi:hypothetical protein
MGFSASCKVVPFQNWMKKKGWHEATPSVDSATGRLEVVLGRELHPAIAGLAGGDTGGNPVGVEDLR